MSKKKIVIRNRRRAKNVEKRVARKLGGLRIGILGGEDVFTGRFSIEVKSRQKLGFEKWYDQAVRNCSEGKIPLLVCHKYRSQKYFVILDLNDFLKLIE